MGQRLALMAVRMLAIDTCPLWEHPNGWRRPGIAYERDHPPVVGWVNVIVLELDGEEHRLLLTTDAA